jgi:hypothetical protein
MLTSNLTRWGAIGAIVGGAIILVALGILSTPVFSGEDPSWYQQNPIWYLVEAAGKVALLVGLVGLYLYLRRSPRFGRLGTLGFYMLIVVTAYNAILPSIALASGSAAESVDNSLGPLYAFGKVLAVLLFGIAILRAGTFPRAGAWLMIFCVPVVLVTIGSFIVGPESFADWSFPVAATLYGLAFITLGSGLWSHRSEPVQPARPARVS